MADNTPEEILELKGFLKKLKRARYTGAKRVVFGERDVTYKTDDEMRQIQRELEDEIRGAEIVATRGRRRRRSTLAVFRSGY